MQQHGSKCFASRLFLAHLSLLLKVNHCLIEIGFGPACTPGRGGGGGGTLIFSHIRRLGSFLGFKILNFNIFWGIQKKLNEYFLGV